MTPQVNKSHGQKKKNNNDVKLLAFERKQLSFSKPIHPLYVCMHVCV